MMSRSRPHILILPRWYPHRYDPMPGLFVRYQAEALTDQCDVTVLYVHPDPLCPNFIETEFAVENGVSVIRVYYLPSVSPVGRWLRFYRAHLTGLAMLGGSGPDLVHVHVLTREGVMGYLVARRLKIPFLISEHWSRYFPENDFFKAPWKKWLTAFIVKRSSAVIAVSEKLRQAMISKGLHHPSFHIVPNVLDMERFRLFPAQPAGEKKTVVHVSCFEDRSKNISGLLDAVKKVSAERSDVTLRLVGDGPDLERMKRYADQLGLSENTVIFNGLKEGEELVREYGNADFSVVSSRFETFGTVITESLACGTPVLATDVGIAPELITEMNGLIVKADDAGALARGFAQLLSGCRNYDRQVIRASLGDRFSPKTVALELMNIYNSILSRTDV
jgi:glycosyltransferase involved in cell wall biosynthesis